MRTLSKQVLDDLFIQLDNLSITSKPREILTVILGWMRSNAEILEQKPFVDYQLNYMSNLNEDEYPVEYSVLHGSEFIHIRNCLKRYTYKDAKFIASMLSNMLDNLFFLEVDVTCSNCQGGGLLVWKNELGGKLVHECAQCGFVHFLEQDVEYHLVPATTLELKQAGLIK
ncbi:hypothetical protein RFH42_16770 [Acinetobacter rudis]|uniref:hypothetical protein n=1 Tax=Acinetobacter rudis TaxID=632955 RepID=UPI00280E2BB2|nr:hypothetical protein [Acinetobacter rudis]MDQ8954598.1 hypothetical protein [Acinetobacter rudis]